MKILVCIKQVRETESLDASGDGDSFRMNRFDEYAVEAALLIREASENVTVDVLTVGPERSAEALKRAVGMGGDHAVHILTPDEEDGNDWQDPFVTASLIARHARNRGYDLILTGAMSEDMMQGQVGPTVAELLSLPCATAVISMQVSPESDTVYAEREVEGGRREAWQLRLPALLALQTGINTPRYPALSHLLRAARQTPEIVEAKTPDIPAIRQEIVSTGHPEKQREGVILEGTPEQKAQALLSIFREKGLVL